MRNITIEDIWKWRREKLRKLEGGWVENAFSLIYKKMEECGPNRWSECDSLYETINLAKCYLEVIRVAGGILNEKPNKDKAKAVYFYALDHIETFDKETKGIIEDSIALQDLKIILSHCLNLANDSMSRLDNIRSQAGF